MEVPSFVATNVKAATDRLRETDKTAVEAVCPRRQPNELPKAVEEGSPYRMASFGGVLGDESLGCYPVFITSLCKLSRFSRSLLPHAASFVFTARSRIEAFASGTVPRSRASIQLFVIFF